MDLDKNIPTLFTFFRILLIPVFVVVFYIPTDGHYIACGIFILAAITDWLDGYLARKLSQTTSLGQFLDPVADKLLVVVALVMVVSEYHMLLISLPAAIIIGREIAVSALREWMSTVGKGLKISVIYMAKLKTAIQMMALTLLIVYSPEKSSLYVFATGVGLLYVSAIFTIWSMYIYLKNAWPDLTLAQNK
ncbi:MAG: CDP-diacylglycerol--glycerol-3-phosphate 3-phosphatidyltransferase [Legionellales bacterium]|nr:CDP-diacylglycerol--glycerol-3-phosphate 3-phosphatidyltransferase [Legionellales bacterium]